MATQRDVKNRIDSVKNIRKITRAMEMVAAARLRRAEQRIAHLRPYAGAIRRMTRQAAEAAGGEVGSLPILKQHEQEQKIAILLVTADRGLAGAFNSQILRAGIRAAADYEGEGRDVTFYASGRRGVSSLAFRKREVVGAYVGFTERPSYADAREIAEDLMAAYIDGEVDRVDIFYNGYVSPLVQEVRRETLLPLQDLALPRAARVDRVRAGRAHDRDAQRLRERRRGDRGPHARDEPRPPGRDHPRDHGGCRRRRSAHLTRPGHRRRSRWSDRRLRRW